MSQHSELLKRLRQLPAARRDELLARLDSGSRRGGNRIAPLSYRQEQLWLFDRVAPTSTAYGLGFTITITGPLDVPALRKAVDTVAERHTVLRSVFPHEHDTGAQIVRAWQPVTFEAEEPDGQDLGKAAADIVQRDLQAGFDINSDPLLRLRLLRGHPDVHVLVVTSHYLVLDPRSAQVLVRELAEAYGQPDSSSDGVPQFGEFARWQREWTQSADASRATEFWGRALAGWEATELTADVPRNRVLDLTSHVASQTLSADVAATVRDLAVRLGVSADDILLAAYYAVLGRHTATKDLIVGVPYDIAGPLDLSRLVGDCGNLLPLRVEIEPAASFVTLVQTVRRHRDEAEQYGQLPFKAILGQLRIEPDVGRLPLVQLGFGSRDRSGDVVTAGALTWSLDPVDTDAGRFEFALEVDLQRAAPEVSVRYAAALYQDSSARRFLRRYLTALTAWAANPEQPMTTVPLADTDEHVTVLQEWNRPIGHARPETVHDLFEQVAAQRADHVAVASRSGSMTYAELDAQANLIAHLLLAQGLRPDSFVPVAVERGPQLIASILGVLKAGGAYVPIDLSLPAERIATLVEDCGAQVAVASADAAALLPTGCAIVAPQLDPQAAAGFPVGPPELVRSAASAAYVIYTSGSTGRPKGVMVEHRNVTAFIRAVQNMFRLNPDDHMLQFASVGFDVSVFEIFGALLSGARLYVANQDERRSVESLDALLADQRITVIDMPPAVMELLTPENYLDLRIAFVGGEAFSGQLTTRWARQREFYNGYGPTEATVTVVTKRCEGQWTASPPIGRAIENHRAYVLSEDLSLVPPGAVGELAISGLGVARGYLGRPDLTAARFRPDPFGPPGSRMYLTGDHARWDDAGDLVFLGRADRQVKVNGVRIELGEVEAALQAVDGVARGIAEVAVDPRRGSMLVAYVVPEDGVDLQLDTIRTAVGQRLPASMVPNVLIPLAEVPLTASGKVDRRALPAVEFAPAQVTEVDDDAHSTPTERTVRAEVFAPLLGMHVGNDVNFFGAGGSSLEAIRIASRVKAVFAVEFPIVEFFNNPTVSGLARLIEQAQERSSSRRDALAAALDMVEGRSDEEIRDLAAQLGVGHDEPGTNG